MRKAMQHVSEMLDARGIPGSDAPITTMGDCPGFITGMQRGKHFAVYVITNVNKAAVTAIFNHSMPPSEEDAEGVTPPPRKHEITNAIIVHSMKCTTMAAREIEACEVKFERFKIEELLRIRWSLRTAPGEILDDEATSVGRGDTAAPIAQDMDNGPDSALLQRAGWSSVPHCRKIWRAAT